MLPWTKMIHLGDPGFTVPVAAAITVALLASRAYRLALYWVLFFAGGMLAVALNKIAFMTWGIGVEEMAFKAVSGHATGASATLPVLFYVLLVLGRDARVGQHTPSPSPSRPSTHQAIALEQAGAGAGVGLGILVAAVLVFTCEHSLSEAVAGCAIGVLISVGALGCAGPLHPARPLTSLLWLAASGFSRVRVDCSAAGKALLLVLLVLMSVYFRLTGENDDLTTDSYLQDLALSLPLLLSASLRRIESDEHTNLRLRRVATVLSDFSFILYVVHIPLLELMRYAGQAWMGQIEVKADSLADLGIFVAMLVVLLLSYGFYLLSEARTAAIRREGAPAGSDQNSAGGILTCWRQPAAAHAQRGFCTI